MSARLAERRWRLAVRMTAAAGVWSLGLLVTALLVPAVGGQTTSAGEATLFQETLVESQGVWGLVLAVVPVLASAVVAAALVYRRREDPGWAVPAAWSAVGVLALIAVLAITSVGAFMVPAAVLLALSVRLAPGWGDVRTQLTRGGAEGADGSGRLPPGS